MLSGRRRPSIPPWAPAVAATLLVLGVYIGEAVLVAGPDTAFQRLGNWDGAWYLSIVNRWYYLRPPGQQQPENFLPLFPGAVRLLHDALPFLSEALVAVLLNVAATCGAMVLVDRAVHTWPLRHRLGLVVLLVMLPAAFFYVAVYTEALFILGVALTLFGVMRSKRWAAAAGAAVATYDRVLGIILVLPVAWIWWRRGRRKSELAPAALALVGLLGLLLTYGIAVGDPLAFVRAQHGWPDHPFTMGAGPAIRSIVDEMLLRNGSHLVPAPLLKGPDLASFAGLWEALAVGVLALYVFWKWEWRSLALTGVLLWLATVVTGGLHSQLRYQLVLLPVWVGAVAVLRSSRRARTAWVIVAVCSFALNLFMLDRFVIGYWVS